VPWRTVAPGIPELGVCRYEDREVLDGDDLRLDTTLPISSLSHTAIAPKNS
jgi:hypothetical protein